MGVIDEIKQIVFEEPAARIATEALAPFGKVYVVGGAPRDIILGRNPKDVDLMAQIDPSTIESVLGNIRGAKLDFTGKNFGVYRFRIGDSEVEIALPRTEESTGTGHKDFAVRTDYTLPVEHDLQRRDFTGNALAVDLADGNVIDPFGGVADLNAGILRTVNDRAFRDDPLRTIRALVSRSRHGLEPDERTVSQMREYAPGVAVLPYERIQAEMDKLIKGQDPHEGIRLGQRANVIEHFFPEISRTVGFDQKNPHHKLALFDHLMEVLKNTSDQTDDPDVRMAALLHDIGKPDSQWIDENGIAHYYRSADGQGDDHDRLGGEMAEKALRRLKYPVQRIQRVKHLVDHHMFPEFNSPRGARKFLQRVGSPEIANDLILLRQADHMGKGNETATRRMADKMRELVAKSSQANAATSLKDLAINGQDVMNTLQIPPGREVGEILKGLMEAVVEDPSLNNRDTLLNMIRSSKTVDAGDLRLLAEVLVEERPVARIVEDVIRGTSSGFTLDKDLEPFTGDTGYITSLDGYTQKIPLEEASLKDVKDYARINKELLTLSPDLYIGGWGEDGFLWLDLSRWFEDIEKAIAFGVENNQLAIYDVAKDEVISLEQPQQPEVAPVL